MATILKPPAPLVIPADAPSVFLAGSIEQGVAEEWQTRGEQALADLPITILNPRRDAWDDSWEQSISNPQFREQVEWELTAQESATLIAMYFAPATKAPITLLELGLFAMSGKVIGCWPQGYWRKGNVDVVCARYGAPVVEDLESLFARVRARLTVELR